VTDPIEAAFIIGFARALRSRGAVLRSRAALGVTRLTDRRPPVAVIASESAVTLKIAAAFDAIAAEIEGLAS
jgi:hypothetical protein